MYGLRYIIQLLLCASCAEAVTVHLEWDRPQYSNSDLATNVVGYFIYWGDAEDALSGTQYVDGVDTLRTSVDFDGEWVDSTFWGTAMYGDGIESMRTPPLLVDNLPPLAPDDPTARRLPAPSSWYAQAEEGEMVNVEHNVGSCGSCEGGEAVGFTQGVGSVTFDFEVAPGRYIVGVKSASSGGSLFGLMIDEMDLGLFLYSDPANQWTWGDVVTTNLSGSHRLTLYSADNGVWIDAIRIVKDQ